MRSANMDICPKTSSAWMVEFQKQLVRGKHVLLYGNIADQFLLNGRYYSLIDSLKHYLVNLGYEIVTTYDIVDGFKFDDKEKMQPIFTRIVEASLRGGPAPATERPAGQSPEPAATRGQASGLRGEPTGPFPPGELRTSGGGGGPPARGSLAAVPVTPGGGSAATHANAFNAPASQQSSTAAGQPACGALLPDPEQALTAIRAALAQPDHSTAVIITFSDKLVGSPDHQDLQERKLLVRFVKVLQESAYLPAGPLQGRKNLLVSVAGKLRDVPELLYKENPLLELIKIPRPSREERVAFVHNFVTYFHGGDGCDSQGLLAAAEDFANLTDGLTAWDLEAIRRTSVAERFTIRQPKLLVDFYKYGLREDPWEKLDCSRIQNARNVLEKRVIGQHHAIRAVESMLMSARVGISMAGALPVGGRPKGVFFFVGPTGVGKTEMAKALTELIFSDESAFARFDMSEYAEQHAAEKLTGAPPGFVGYDEGGLLTNRVRERPFSLLLFDEIEKAHGSVMDKFLQILEDGRLTDGKGQTAYFSHSVIIFTSNIGSDSLVARGRDHAQLADYEHVQQHYKRAVVDHFNIKLGRPELLNRLGENILVFDILRPEFVAGIFAKFLHMLSASVRERTGLEMVLPDGSLQSLVAQRMAMADNLLYGGRRVKTMLEEIVERPLNRWIFTRTSSAQRMELTADLSNQVVYVNGEPLD